MISYSPNGSTIYTPTHSFTWEEDIEYIVKKPYWTSGSMWEHKYYDGFTPRVHLAKNPNNTSGICYMPSSLLKTISDDSSIASQPTVPKFQFVRNTRIQQSADNNEGGQCYVRFKVDSSNYSMAFTDGQYSSHLYCAQAYNSDDGYYYGMIQPIGFTNDYSVLVNTSSNTMDAAYNIHNVSDGYNRNMSEYTQLKGDHVNKVLLSDPNGTKPAHYKYVSVNFMIAIQSSNYNFLDANQTVSVFGISIPFNYVRFYSASDPPWTYRFLDVIDNTNRIGLEPADHSLLTLESSKCSFIRGRKSVTSGYYPNFDYYSVFNKIGNTQYVWLSGQYSFKLHEGYPGSGCPKGYDALAICSPIVTFLLNEYELYDKSNKFVELTMSCAENIEIWTP